MRLRFQQFPAMPANRQKAHSIARNSWKLLEISIRLSRLAGTTEMDLKIYFLRVFANARKVGECRSQREFNERLRQIYTKYTGSPSTLSKLKSGLVIGPGMR
jgi:hypothetical protein